MQWDAFLVITLMWAIASTAMLIYLGWQVRKAQLEHAAAERAVEEEKRKLEALIHDRETGAYYRR
jgi:threonine/homoserine/homoserine lactone efflux protein